MMRTAVRSVLPRAKNITAGRRACAGIAHASSYPRNGAPGWGTGHRARAADWSRSPQSPPSTGARHLSSAGGGGRGNRGGDGEKADDDPFGVDYDDEGTSGLGPPSSLPPRLVRDPNTGALTGETEAELTPRDKSLLAQTPKDRLDELAARIEEAWTVEKSERLAGRVLDREAEMARTVRDRHPDKAEWEAERKRRAKVEARERKNRERDFKKAKRRNMTAEEAAYQKLLDDNLLTSPYDDDDDDDDDGEDALGDADDDDDVAVDPSKYPPNPWEGENLAWVARDVDPLIDEDVVLPPELSRPRLLNRREATPLPKDIIHHNNLDLLRRYVTPGGQIMDRSRTRLGAKDQRKVARLVKRARKMGLIPHVGRWKVHDDGDVSAVVGEGDDGGDGGAPEADWERVMERVGVLGVARWKVAGAGEMSAEERERWIQRGRAMGVIEEGVGEGGEVELVDELKGIKN